MNTPTLTPPAATPTAPEDPDLAEQARPGHGVPSQDPNVNAQVALRPEEVEREARSTLVGGGALAGAATGALVGVAVAGPVGVLVGGTVGAVAGAMGGSMGGAAMGASTDAEVPSDVTTATGKDFDTNSDTDIGTKARTNIAAVPAPADRARHKT